MFWQLIDDIEEAENTLFNKTKDDADAINKARQHIAKEERKYSKKVSDTVKSEITDMFDDITKRYGEIIGVGLSEMSRVSSVLLNGIAKGFKENKK